MLEIKPFRQKTGYCGPASLKMVLSYYGIGATEQELVKKTDCSLELGVEAWKIIKAAQEYGLQGFIKDEASLEDLRHYVLTKQIPVIVDWFSDDDGHYSVVVDIDGENIYLLDPEIGYIRAMRLDRFKRVWFDFPGDFIQSRYDLNIRRMIVIYKEIKSPKK